jgi:hypothetical protein
MCFYVKTSYVTYVSKICKTKMGINNGLYNFLVKN